MKEQIDGLKLEWDDCAIAVDSELQRLVLSQLEPSTNLKTFSIKNYGGTKFPNWLGDSSFCNMVSLFISKCDNCCWLPPLGQLPKLKKLKIYMMKSVKTVGGEFYGSNSPSFQSFRSLEILSFKWMPEWEEWKLSVGTVIEFPSLRHLSLTDCPKLKGHIPNSSFPSLTKLELDGYVPFMSRETETGVFSQLMLPFNSLRQLSITGFPSLTSFPRDGLPKTLKSLCINRCPDLEFLPRESLHNYKSLEDLEIQYSCDSMDSFTLGSLPVLESLHLQNCRNLKSILIAEDASLSLSFLRSITIKDCNELESFSAVELPTPNLIDFHVFFCEKLESLPERINTLTALQKLTIIFLPNLQSFAKEGLPTNLRELDVGNRGGISWNQSITEWRLERLTCLSELRIRGDDILNRLMKIEVPLLPASLTSLCISVLKDIESLDGRWLQNLTSLQKLQICNCFNLKSLPEEGLPSTLKQLLIEVCPSLDVTWKMERGKEWPKIAHIPIITIEARNIIS